MKIKQPIIPVKKSATEAARIYRKNLIDSGGKTLTFAGEKPTVDILNTYKALGYTSKDLLNFAVSLLPENMPD